MSRTEIATNKLQKGASK